MKTVTIQIKNTNLIEDRCNRRENYRTGKYFQKKIIQNAKQKQRNRKYKKCLRDSNKSCNF